MSGPTLDLLALLDLQTVGADLFRGHSPPDAGKQVYGGQAVAQALVAATRTVPADRPAHSLHAYFVLAGDPRTPIEYAVERVRDGKSFTTRRCVASQNGRTIFTMEASFQVAEEGFEHAVAMPEAPPPEVLPDRSAIAERFQDFLPKAARQWLERAGALDIRVVLPESLAPRAGPSRTRQFIWLRLNGPAPADQATHAAVLAYLSDMTLLNTALLAHGRTIFDPCVQVASLDHALWLHRAFRVDDWLLYAQESPSASGARALTRGEIFTRDGRLVASVAQEGLVRRRAPPPAPG
jgi:acyl-CoA thioesterase-2